MDNDFLWFSLSAFASAFGYMAGTSFVLWKAALNKQKELQGLADTSDEEAARYRMTVPFRLLTVSASTKIIGSITQSRTECLC